MLISCVFLLVTLLIYSIVPGLLNHYTRIMRHFVATILIAFLIMVINQMEYKDGQKTSTSRKIFPGYILVQMEMDDESWFVVRNTPGVTGFVSAQDENENRPKPVPLEQDEVDNILNQIKSEEPRVRVGFAAGQTVRITDGPFLDFMGAVDEVYPDRAKVKVLVSFFGRETPVELDFLQVEKA